jgi:AhpD family alkylhydroperoxidase
MPPDSFNLGTEQPALYKATAAMSKLAESAVLDSGLSRQLVELVRIRVSQVNGCGFCMRMHSADAVAHGVTADKLAVLPGWRETDYFDDLEREALALAERVTKIGSYRALDRQEPVVVLTPSQAAAVAWLAIVMNVWNRVAIGSHYEVAPVR